VTTPATITLYRSGGDVDAVFWTPDRSHAEKYRTRPPFGGPTVISHSFEVDEDRVLDLRSDPWGRLADLFGIDSGDYEHDPALIHFVFQDLAPLFAADGYDWVRWLESGFGGEEWLRLR
jgi:hypothetical protein